MIRQKYYMLLGLVSVYPKKLGLVVLKPKEPLVTAYQFWNNFLQISAKPTVISVR